MSDDDWRNWALAVPKYWSHQILGAGGHRLTRHQFYQLRRIGCYSEYQPIFGDAEQRRAVEALIREAARGHALQKKHSGAEMLKAMFLSAIHPIKLETEVYEQCQRAIIDRAIKMLCSDGTPHPERVLLALSPTGKRAYEVTLARDLVAEYLARETMLTINVDRLVARWMKYCRQLDRLILGAAGRAAITEWSSDDTDLKWLQETKEPAA